MRRRRALALVGGVGVSTLAGCSIGGSGIGAQGSCSTPSTDDLQSLFPSNTDTFSGQYGTSMGVDGIGTDDYFFGRYTDSDGGANGMLIAKYSSQSEAESDVQAALSGGTEPATGYLVTGQYLVLVDAQSRELGRALVRESELDSGCASQLSFSEPDSESNTPTSDESTTGSKEQVAPLGFESGDVTAWKKAPWSTNGIEITRSTVRSGSYAGKVVGQGAGSRSVSPITADGSVVPFSVRSSNAGGETSILLETDKRSSGNVVANIGIFDGQLAYKDGSNIKSLQPAESGTWYDIAARLNFSDQTYDIDVGLTGTYDVTGVTFSADPNTQTSSRATEFSNVLLFTSQGRTGYFDLPQMGKSQSTQTPEPVESSLSDGWENGNLRDPLWEVESGVSVVEESAPDGGSHSLQMATSGDQLNASTANGVRWDAPWTLDGLFRIDTGGDSPTGYNLALNIYLAGEQAKIRVRGPSDGNKIVTAKLAGLRQETSQKAVAWQPDTWHRYKCRHDGDGTYKLKFWNAGDDEPESYERETSGNLDTEGKRHPLGYFAYSGPYQTVNHAYINYRTDAAADQ